VIPEPTYDQEDTPLTWHEPSDDLARPPYDSTEVAAIVDAWAPKESA
jgi:hypothetical protein